MAAPEYMEKFAVRFWRI